VIRFDGSDDCLAIKNLFYDTTGSIGGITMCAVVRSASEDLQILASFDRKEYWSLALRATATTGFAWDTTGASGGTDDLRATESHTDGAWHLVCAWFAAGASPDKRIFVDGKEVIASTAHGGDALGSGANRFGFIGVGSEADTFDGTLGSEHYLNGDLAELALFERALDDDERERLERYFMARYGT
jgi:hypothetical protein